MEEIIISRKLWILYKKVVSEKLGEKDTSIKKKTEKDTSAFSKNQKDTADPPNDTLVF